jgi:hypothetical protein
VIVSFVPSSVGHVNTPELDTLNAQLVVELVVPHDVKFTSIDVRLEQYMNI